MKTLPRMLTLAVLVAIGLVVILTFRAFAPTPNPKFTLTIEEVTALKDGSDNGKENFRKTLKTCGKRGYHVRMVHGNKPDEPLDGNDQGGPQSKLNIKTDKVTTSEIVKNAPSGELTLIQVHVTQTVSTRTAADMAKVVALV